MTRIPTIPVIPALTPASIFTSPAHGPEPATFTQTPNPSHFTQTAMKFQTLMHFSDDVAPMALQKLPKVLEKMANDEGIEEGRISVALLTDDEIRVVNRDYLQHDYETDVISFDLSDDDEFLDGELVISVDTAKRLAVDAGWEAEDEVLLYAIHGMLHILGYDDDTDEHRDEMRLLEAQYLKEFDVQGWENHPTHGEAHTKDDIGQ